MEMRNARVVIADTNVISYELKSNPLAVAYERILTGRELHISFVTVAELHYWAEKHEWGARRRLQLRCLLGDIPIFPYNKGVAEMFARIRIERERTGRPMGTSDLWIAATAVHFDVPLATHDGNFLDTPGLRVISANPEVCMQRDRFVEARRAMDLNLRCGCGL